MELERTIQEMREAVIAGDRQRARDLARLSMESDYDPLVIIEQGIRAGMDVVGERFATGEYFLPDLVMAGGATKEAITVLEPYLQSTAQKPKARVPVVLATVKGDIHEIGKTLVGTMLTANGFEVHDLGVDVPADKIVQAVVELDARLVGLSALLTTTMVQQRVVIEALQAAGVREKIRVMVGGAPINAEWAAEIGADAYADHAAAAATTARHLLSLG